MKEVITPFERVSGKIIEMIGSATSIIFLTSVAGALGGAIGNMVIVVFFGILYGGLAGDYKKILGFLYLLLILAFTEAGTFIGAIFYDSSAVHGADPFDWMIKGFFYFVVGYLIARFFIRKGE